MSIFTAASNLQAIAVRPSLAGVSWWGIQNAKLMQGTSFVSPPSEWDIVRVGPNKQPLNGLVEVRRCGRRMKLHRKEHPASDYETQTFQGFSVVEFDFDLLIWSAAQLASVQNTMVYLFPGAGNPPPPYVTTTVPTVSSTTNLVNPQVPTAISTQAGQQVQQVPNQPNRPPVPVVMSHPALQIHGVDKVVVTHVEGPLQKSKSIPDLFVMHFKCVQFRPSVPVQAKTLTASLTTNLGSGGQLVDHTGGIAASQVPNLPPDQSGGSAPNFTPANFTPGP